MWVLGEERYIHTATDTEKCKFFSFKIKLLWSLSERPSASNCQDPSIRPNTVLVYPICVLFMYIRLFACPIRIYKWHKLFECITVHNYYSARTHTRMTGRMMTNFPPSAPLSLPPRCLYNVYHRNFEVSEDLPRSL